MITLSLPLPPSVNHYWRHLTKGPLAGRTLISEEGRKYRKSVLTHCFAVNRSEWPVQDRISVDIELNPPDYRRRDLDNSLKALLDALQHAGLYKDDSQIDDLRIRRGKVSAVPGVKVTISQLTNQGTLL